MATPPSFACSVAEVSDCKEPRVIVRLPNVATGNGRFSYTCEPAASSLEEVSHILPVTVRLPPPLSVPPRTSLKPAIDLLICPCGAGGETAPAELSDVKESTLASPRQLEWQEMVEDRESLTRQTHEQIAQTRDAQPPCMLSTSHEVSCKRKTEVDEQPETTRVIEAKLEGLARSRIPAQWRSWGALIWPVTMPATRSYERWTRAWESGFSPRL